MELARNEQLKERQEMEKKLQKFAKTMDYLERAKRQEEAPLIEQAFQKRLEEEKILHEQEQLVSFLLFFYCLCSSDNCQQSALKSFISACSGRLNSASNTMLATCKRKIDFLECWSTRLYAIYAFVIKPLHHRAGGYCLVYIQLVMLYTL
jgi:hypothetical protein